MSIGNKRRKKKEVVRGQIVSQEEIEKFKVKKNREKQSWRRMEKAKLEVRPIVVRVFAALLDCAGTLAWN